MAKDERLRSYLLRHIDAMLDAGDGRGQVYLHRVEDIAVGSSKHVLFCVHCKISEFPGFPGLLTYSKLLLERTYLVIEAR
jgi:hypothetical protein